jgi:hypothetical protein
MSHRPLTNTSSLKIAAAYYTPMIYTAPCIMFWLRARAHEGGFRAHTVGLWKEVHKGT